MASESNDLNEKDFPSNFSNYLKELSTILKNPTKSEITKSLAGIQLKNALFSKEELTKIQYQERWLRLPEDLRELVKTNLIESLTHEVKRPSHAAQSLAYIAYAEIPNGLWPDCIDCLIKNVTDSNSNDMLKELSLDIICYIFHEINPNMLKPYANQLLKIISDCLDKESADELRQCSITILNESINFTKSIFDEKSIIIERIVCKSIKESMNDQTKLIGLKYLEKLLELYYLQNRLDHVLFEGCLNSIKSTNIELSLQSIFIWINLLKLEQKEKKFNSDPQLIDSIKKLVPILFECLLEQKNNEDDDEWTPFKASCICLILVSNCFQNEAFDQIKEFIDTNISDSEWRKRDSALIAIGSLLRLRNEETLKKFLDERLDILNCILEESNEIVRETAQCLAFSICKLFPDYLYLFNGLKEINLLKSFKFNLLNRDLYEFEIKLNKHKKYRINFNNDLDAKSVTSTDDNKKNGRKHPNVSLIELNQVIKSLKHVDQELEKNSESTPVDEKDTPAFLLVKLKHVNTNLS